MSSDQAHQLPASDTGSRDTDDVGFLGNHSLTLDDKYRLPVPAKFRPVLHRRAGVKDGGSVKVVVTVSMDQENLEVHLVPEWNKYLKDFESQSAFNVKAKALHKWVTSVAEDVEMDGQGRIRISKTLLELAHIEKRVIVTGQTEKFLIWDEQRYKQFQARMLVDAGTMAQSVADQAVPKPGPA